MTKRDELMTRAQKRDFAAVDALVAEGAGALEEILDAMAHAKTSTADTLGEAVRRMDIPANVSVSKFLTPETPLEAFSAAVDVLARAGDPNGELQRFVETTAPDFETLRGVALKGMALTHDPKVAPFIRKVAEKAEKEDQDFLLADAIEALTMAGDHSLDEKAATMLRGRDPEIKLRAAALLPNLFFPGLLELLGAATRQRTAEVRGKAAEAFYYLGTKTAAAALVKLSRDRDASVKEDAAARATLIAGEELDVDKLTDDKCWRMGEPIDLQKLAERASEPALRFTLARELFVETGHDFAFNPSRPDGDPGFADRARAWMEANGGRFEKGGCYKFGFKQDLTSLEHEA